MSHLALLIVSERMWPLGEFRFDADIQSDEVFVLDADGSGEEVLMSTDTAIALAHRRGLNLVAEGPDGELPDGQPPFCVVAKVTTPLRWERLRVPDTPEPIDEKLWFEAPCGRRDFLVGNGHTFVGRMAAWCPHDGVGYNVSLHEMGAMSEPCRYFIAGYLAGSEPGYPVDVDGDTDEADLLAWQSATRRYRRTGDWYGRWGTCQICGCVLLPDSHADTCEEHATSTDI